MRLTALGFACVVLFGFASTASAQQPEYGAVELRLLTGDPPQPVGDDVEIHYVVNRGGSSTKPKAGALSLQRVPAPESRIYVNATGFMPAKVTVQVEPGGTTRLELVLERGGSLSGKVTCEPGPAGGHVVLAGVPPGLDTYWMLGTFPLDDDGRFAVSGLDPDLDHRLVVHVPGNLPVEIQEGVTDGAELEVELPTDVAYEVLVHDQAGEPVPGATVSGRMQTPRGYHFRGDLRAQTDDNGVVFWRGAGAPSMIELSARAPGYVRQELPRSELARSPVRVVLLTSGQLVTVSGLVLDEHGEPVAGANLSARVDGNRISTETGADGRFTLERCSPGKVIAIQVYADGYALALVERQVPPTGLRGEAFRLERGVTLRVRLTGPHVSGVYAVLLQQGGISYSKIKSAFKQGVATFDRVSKGTWRVSVNYKVDGEVRSQRRVVELNGDEEIEVEVE